MIPIKTKEHLVYFMQCGMMRLSKYDLRFVQNLMAMTSQQITTNQVALFDKLLDKYKRQLFKHGLTPAKLAELNWETKIIASDPKFSEASVSVTGNTITFKSPFNKKFIDQFKKIEHNPYAWNKDKKIYEAPFSTQALKYLLSITHDIYPVVNYCPELTRMLNTLDKYSAPYWNPTLIKCNDIYLIAAINEHLHSAINNIEISCDPECISFLASCGVKIDDKVINQNATLKFASEFNPEVDITDIDSLVENLRAIKCDVIFLSGRSKWALHYKKILEEKIQDTDLVIDDKINEILESRLEGKKNPVMFYLSSGLAELRKTNGKFRKIIKLKNSTPVNIK